MPERFENSHESRLQWIGAPRGMSQMHAESFRVSSLVDIPFVDLYVTRFFGLGESAKRLLGSVPEICFFEDRLALGMWRRMDQDVVQYYAKPHCTS